jgi:hypothetical protein
MNTPNLRPKSKSAVDPLRHFAKDGPFVKLTALFLWRLPWIVSPVGVVCLTAGKLLKWW